MSIAENRRARYDYFIEERFEAAEVYFGGVGFHLPEVGIDRGVEGEAGAQGRLGVKAHATGEGAVERILRTCRGAPRGIAGHVR